MGLALAEMSQIDQAVCQGFQGVVQLAKALEAQQQAPELAPNADRLTRGAGEMGRFDQMGREEGG